MAKHVCKNWTSRENCQDCQMWLHLHDSTITTDRHINCQLQNLEMRQSYCGIGHNYMCHMKTVLEYYIVSSHSVSSTGNATTYFHEKWKILESVCGIWVLKYSSACPHLVFHPSSVYAIMLCQPLLVLQFSFLYLFLLFHGNTSYKWNSGFHTLSTTSRVGPGVTVSHLPH